METKEKLLYIFVAISGAIFVLESYIPRPLPWMKLGLANVVTILLVYFFPLNFILKVVIYRVIIGSIFTASLFTPTFFLSFSGGVCSAISMYFGNKFLNKFLSPLGISVLGAEAHIIAQLIVVYFFIIKDKDVFLLLPYLLIYAMISGIIIGLIGRQVIEEFKKFYNSYLASSI